MLFNVDKCIVLHMGSRNQRGKYEMGGIELNSVEQERDLGVIILIRMESHQHNALWLL